jgi:Flp pilus assembly protein TadB
MINNPDGDQPKAGSANLKTKGYYVALGLGLLAMLLIKQFFSMTAAFGVLFAALVLLLAWSWWTSKGKTP